VTSGGIACKQNVIQFSSKYQGISLKIEEQTSAKSTLAFSTILKM